MSEQLINGEQPAQSKAAATTATLGNTPQGRSSRVILLSPPNGTSAAADGGARQPAGGDDEGAKEANRSRFLPRRMLETTIAVVISMIVHAALIIALGLFFLRAVEAAPKYQELVVTEVERQEELLNQVLDEETIPTKQLAFTSSLPVGSQPGGGGGQISGVAAPTLDRSVGAPDAPPQINVGDLSEYSSPGNHFAMDLPDGTLGEPQAIVDDYQQAMDRITQEILNMLAKGKVLVIWCFDQSESMRDDQKEIRERIERVYAELGLSEAAQGDALWTAVTSYGDGFRVHTQRPTSELEEIRNAISDVPVDESGVEKMCGAVEQSIATFHKYATSGRRQMALILVTDESGDPADNGHLEDAIGEARGTRTTIYVLGREAVFGYPYAFMNWVDPSTEINFWLQIDRGPETPFAEQLQIDGFTRRWDAHASGFGPYEQVRMARQTGGVFFMLPSPEVNLVARDDRKYELEAMRPYLPDLSPRIDYARERDESDFRRTIWKVITDLNPYDSKSSPYCTVQVTFPIAPQDFAKAAVENQKTAVGMVRYLDEAQKVLEKLKPQRRREYSRRWQANYDLIYAQVLAYKVRIYEYGAYLEAFVKQPKLIKNPLGPAKKTTHWDIRTRAETITGDLTKEYIIEAKELLEGVIREHPGTPWAARAQWELNRGFGVELVEAFYDPRRGGVKVPKL